MSLNHVCIWDSEIGYRRVTVEEACEMHPYGASARSGFFVCELCAQNVLLTAPGVNVRHFRHDPASPNKECDERQAYFDPTYGRSLRSLNSHAMPLRLAVNGTAFSLQLGFFYPPDHQVYCDRIKIANESHDVYEYSFERIERIGTTYLSVGSIPSQVYGIEYENASAALKRYWPNNIQGVNLSGSFFDCSTGRILQSGGKAYAGNCYYLLQRRALYSCPADIEAVEIARSQSSGFVAWYLYRIKIKKFSAASAKFFLKYAIFLTEKPTEFYPIWPPYTEDPYFIYHNSNEFYFFLCGDDAELKSFPAATRVTGTQDGKLYKIQTREKEQLVSFGKSGALGFSYLIKQPLVKTVSTPLVTIRDHAGNILAEDSYTKVPKSKLISVLCQYDGKAVVFRNGKTVYIHKIFAGKDLIIDELSIGTEIHFYQGCDCIRTLRFDRAVTNYDISALDDALVEKLRICSGSMISISHSFATVVNKFELYPKTKQWIYAALRRGEMSRSAYRTLINYRPRKHN